LLFRCCFVEKQSSPIRNPYPMMAELTVNPVVTTVVTSSFTSNTTTNAVEVEAPVTTPEPDPVVAQANTDLKGAEQVAAQNAAALMEPSETALNVNSSPKLPIPPVVEDGVGEGVIRSSDDRFTDDYRFQITAARRDAKITEAVNGNPNLTPEQRTKGLATLAQQNQARETAVAQYITPLDNQIGDIIRDPQVSRADSLSRDIERTNSSINTWSQPGWNPSPDWIPRWQTENAARQAELTQIQADPNYQAKQAQIAALEQQKKEANTTIIDPLKQSSKATAQSLGLNTDESYISNDVLLALDYGLTKNSGSYVGESYTREPDPFERLF
jgi:hypothetical protein